MAVTGYAGELEALYAVLEAGWSGEGGLHPGMPIAKQWGPALNPEVQCKDGDGNLPPYLRFTVKGADGRPFGIGDPGNNDHLYVSVLLIDVFVATADGEPLARSYADEILALYRAAKLYPIRRAYFTGVGLASHGWYQGAVTIKFERHELQ